MKKFKVLVILEFVAVQIAGGSPIFNDLDADVLLESLSSGEMESLFDSSTAMVQSKIIQIYEKHLENYYRSVDNLEIIGRLRRDIGDEKSLLPSFQQDIWHSGEGDIQFDNREILKIESIAVHNISDVQIQKVLPLNLWNLPALYLNNQGVAMILKDGNLVSLWVRNIHTTSLTGCQCNDLVSKNCACCVPGACLCKDVEGDFGDVCVPCGQESNGDTCAASSHYPLKTEVAVGFEYYLDVHDPVEGLQRVIITSKGKTVSFYKMDNEGLQPMQFENGMTTMNFAQPITHLGFGETYMDVHGSIQKRRYLVTFRAGKSDHQFHGLDIASTKLKSGLSQMWHSSGTDMKVWNSEGRIMVGVQRNKEILIYEMKANRLHEYQMIYMQSIICNDQILSWKSFTMNFENYVMAVSNNVAQIYHQEGIYYQYMQHLEPIPGLSAFHDIVDFTIPSCRDKPVLLTGEGTILAAYTWNGTAQEIQLVYTSTVATAVTDWSTGYAYIDSTGFDPIQVIIKGGHGTISLEINATLQELPDPMQVQVQSLHNTIEDLEEEYQKQNNITTTFRDRLSSSIEDKTSAIGPITIRDGFKIAGVLETDDLVADNIYLNPLPHFGSDHKLDYDHHIEDHNKYDAIIDELEGEMSSMLHTLKGAIQIGDSSRVIEGKKTLLGGLTVESLDATEMNFDVSQNESGFTFPFDKVLADMARYDDTRPITGKKILTSPLRIGNLIAEYLDDIPVSDLVTTTGNVTVTGVIFSTLEAETIIVPEEATIGGVFVDSLPSVNESFSLGHCTFHKNLTVNNIMVNSNIVDNIDLEHLNSKTLKRTGGIVSGPLEFTNELEVQNLKAKYLMGINTEKFMTETVFTDQPATIHGTLTLPGLVVEKDLLVKGNINGKRFPESYPILGEEVLQFGAKSFDHLEVDTVKMGIGSKVDGLSVVDIVTLSKEQYIFGEKSFMGGITILGNLEVTSKMINGINIDQLNAKIHAPKLPENKTFDVIFEGDLQVETVLYNGTLNDLNLTALAEDIIYDDESPIIIESTKTFKSGLNISNAVFESTFNGEDFNNLVRLDKEQNITGKKIFDNFVSFTNITVFGLVDNVDLLQLEKNVLYRNRPGQRVTGRKIFTDSITVQDLEVTGKVNEVDFKNVVTKDGPQTFTAPQIIHSGEFNVVTANSIEMDDPVLVMGVNLSAINENRISLSSPFNHDGALTVTGPVTVNGSLFINFVNNHEVEHLFDNIVMTNEPSVIESNIIFANLIVYGSVGTKDSRGANGVSIKDINSNAVHLNSSDVLNDNSTWDEIVLESDVIGTGLFNGFDLHKLNKDAVFKDVPNQIITGKKTFVNGFYVKGNIEAEIVNEIDLRKRLLSRNTEQIITAPYTFSNIVAKKNINILGKFNNLNMSFMASDFLKQSQVTLRGNITFHKSIAVQHLQLQGLLNDIHLIDLLQDAVKLNDTSVIISGLKTFTQSPDMPNANVRLLNGVDFADYLHHVITIDLPMNITGILTVNGSVTMPEASTDDLVVKGSVDGVDVGKLENDVIHLDEDRIINASIEITGDVYIKGDIDASHLNGHNIETDFLTKDTKQDIPYNVTFQNIWTSDVDVGGLVNSWNLPSEVEATLMTTGGQTISGFKIFTGPVRVLGKVEVTGKVGTDFKVKLARQAVQLGEEAEIEGLLMFSDPLKVNYLSSSTDMINGINFTELSDKAWLVDKPAKITGRMVFDSDVHFMDGLYYNSTTDDGPTLGDIHRESMTLASDVSDMTVELNKKYSELCVSVVSLNLHLENAIYEGDYFDIIRREKFTLQRHSSFAFQAFNTTYVIMSWEGEQCDSTLYRFNPKRSQLEEINTISNSGFGHQWLFLESGRNAYLAMASSSVSKTCSRNTTTIWKVLENDTIIIHQEMVPGKQMSFKYLGGGGVKVFVHAADQTTTYKLNPTTQVFEKYIITAEVVDISLSMHLKDKTNVMFRTHKGYGKVLINGRAGPKLELARDIIDAVLFEQNGKVMVTLSAITYVKQKPAYVIKLYSLDIITKSLRWLDIKDVDSAANLTSFFAGNEASGTTFIIVAQSNRFPLVYTLLGEKLKIFTELDIPRVEWMQYIGVPGQKYQTFPDHFVLFGQKDKTIVITQLIMKGASVSKGESDVECNFQFLTKDNFIKPDL